MLLHLSHNFWGVLLETRRCFSFITSVDWSNEDEDLLLFISFYSISSQLFCFEVTDNGRVNHFLFISITTFYFSPSYNLFIAY